MLSSLSPAKPSKCIIVKHRTLDCERGRQDREPPRYLEMCFQIMHVIVAVRPLCAMIRTNLYRLTLISLYDIIAVGLQVECYPIVRLHLSIHKPSNSQSS